VIFCYGVFLFFFKLCLCTNVWVAAGQALVAAITGEANRILSLDLSNLRDSSQLAGRTAIINSGQGTEGSTLAHRHHTHLKVLYV
jgi:hypothetical protein